MFDILEMFYNIRKVLDELKSNAYQLIKAVRRPGEKFLSFPMKTRCYFL